MIKRLLSALLCAVLLAGLAAPAFAAGTVSFSMSPSASTLHKGDTVTFTVSVESSEHATSYGFMLSYDSSALELVGGNCTVGGTLVSSFNNGFAFMFQNPTAYSGTVGTVTFKIKENAALGGYTVSGSASVKNGTAAVSASGSAKTLTVACNHSFGSWTKASEAAHKRICALCQKEETGEHSWNSGSVTKQPSCKETGTKTYTCTTCSATKTDSVDKTTDHKYGTWTKANDATHNRTCSVCFKEETANHNWNSGSVTKQPSCKETGTKTYTCTICNATKQDPIYKLTTHTYDNCCDASCNVCGETRTVNHTYKTSCDKTSHWQECSLCKDKKSEAVHTPGAAATETKAQTCTTCDYVINPALGHKHSYATTWTADNTGHWYACTGCAEKGSGAAHKFENACDKDCSVCGFTRETDHAFAEAWTTDENNHWHLCTACGLQQAVAAHEPGPAATATTAQVCTICSMEMAPALGIPETTEATEHSETVEPTETTEATVPVETEEPTEISETPQSATTETKFPFWIPITVIAFLLCIAATIAIIKKR